MPAVATEVIKFRSENRGLRVVRRSGVERMNSEGRMVLVLPEIVYDFNAGGEFSGWLEVTPGQDLLPDAPPFDLLTGEGQLQDAASWLRTFAQENGRFAEVVPEARPIAELLHELAEAQIAGDIELVGLIGDEEAATFQRPEVLSRAKAAYDALSPPPPKK